MYGGGIITYTIKPIKLFYIFQILTTIRLRLLGILYTKNKKKSINNIYPSKLVFLRLQTLQTFPSVYVAI